MPNQHTGPLDLVERFWSHVDPCRTDGCALWLGALVKGYGAFPINRKQTYAHHFLVGKPPAGLEWDHVRERGCTHKECVWPEHLELVTHRENMIRARAGEWQTRKTRCPHGHEYTPENTYHRPRGGRACRLCRKVQSA